MPWYYIYKNGRITVCHMKGASATWWNARHFRHRAPFFLSRSTPNTERRRRSEGTVKMGFVEPYI